jgi:hypothetical protein
MVAFLTATLYQQKNQLLFTTHAMTRTEKGNFGTRERISLVQDLVSPILGDEMH